MSFKENIYSYYHTSITVNLISENRCFILKMISRFDFVVNKVVFLRNHVFSDEFQKLCNVAIYAQRLGNLWPIDIIYQGYVGKSFYQN